MSNASHVTSRRPVPPNCVEVAAVMTDLTVAPPDDDNPLIQGPSLRYIAQPEKTNNYSA